MSSICVTSRATRTRVREISRRFVREAFVLARRLLLREASRRPTSSRSPTSLMKVCHLILVQVCVGVKLLLKYQSQTGKTLKELKEFTASNKEFQGETAKIAEAVENFAAAFDIPGNDEF